MYRVTSDPSPPTTIKRRGNTPTNDFTLPRNEIVYHICTFSAKTVIQTINRIIAPVRYKFFMLDEFFNDKIDDCRYDS